VASGSEENRAGDGPEAGMFRLQARNDLNGEQFDGKGRISPEMRPAARGRGRLAAALKWLPLSRDCKEAKSPPYHGCDEIH
jgi:hypothetical protein